MSTPSDETTKYVEFQSGAVHVDGDGAAFVNSQFNESVLKFGDVTISQPPPSNDTTPENKKEKEGIVIHNFYNYGVQFSSSQLNNSAIDSTTRNTVVQSETTTSAKAQTSLCHVNTSLNVQGSGKDESLPLDLRGSPPAAADHILHQATSSESGLQQFSSNESKKFLCIVDGNWKTFAEKSTIIIINLETKISERKLKLPFEQYSGCVIAVGDRILCFGGQANFACGRVVAYDQAHEVVIEPDDYDVNKIKNLTQARAAAKAVLLGGCVHVSGGFDESIYNALSSCEVYSIENDSWSSIPDMINPRGFHAAVSWRGCFVCIGGWNGFKRLKTVEYFDPRQGKWTKLPPLNCARFYHAAAVIDDAIYVIGGQGDNKTILKSVEKYTEAGGWCSVAEMNVARKDHAACVANGRIFVAGGVGDKGSKKSVEVYDPTEDTWTMFCELDKEYCEHSLVAL